MMVRADDTYEPTRGRWTLPMPSRSVGRVAVFVAASTVVLLLPELDDRVVARAVVTSDETLALFADRSGRLRINMPYPTEESGPIEARAFDLAPAEGPPTSLEPRARRLVASLRIHRDPCVMTLGGQTVADALEAGRRCLLEDDQGRIEFEIVGIGSESIWIGMENVHPHDDLLFEVPFEDEG